MKKKTIQRIRAEGSAARRAGVLASECPYDHLRQAHAGVDAYPRACRKAWQAGWAGKSAQRPLLTPLEQKGNLLA